MKKIIIFIIALLILSGCTIKSNISVNYDGSVKEEVYLLSSNESLENDYKKIVDNKITSYKSILDVRKYKYTYEKGKELSGAKVYKSYDNICSYFSNSAFNQYVYKYIKCEETDEYFEISNASDYIPYCPECGNWPALDDIEYKVVLPTPATEQNADKIDGSTYIWKYDKNTKDKNFYLKISKNDLKKYEKEYKANLVKQKTVRKIVLVSVLIGVLILLGITGLMLYRKNQKNKLDY